MARELDVQTGLQFWSAKLSGWPDLSSTDAAADPVGT